MSPSSAGREIRLNNSLSSGLPGTIILPSTLASERAIAESKPKSAALSSIPWHLIQFSAKTGKISRLKSTCPSTLSDGEETVSWTVS